MARTDVVLDTYLESYRSLIAFEQVDGSVVLSFPLHLAASHRIEVSVSDLGNDRCILSDSGRTLGEVEDAGFTLTKQMQEKVERVAGLSGLRIVSGYLLLESTYAELGIAIQRFLEASKTIGDVYLVYKQRPMSEDDLVEQVKEVLDSHKILYRQRERVQGKIEAHPFHFFSPANGHANMAVSILTGMNTHNVAQVWRWKCDDIRREEANRNMRLALVYDVRSSKWSPTSRKILEDSADVALPSDSLQELPRRLTA